MLPPLRPWPFRIADENGKQFLGAIESIDTHSKAIIARELRNKGPEKRFNLADNCAIVSNGKLDTKLSNLRAGETVSLSYDNDNGVLVANRITPESSQSAQNITASPQLQAYNSAQP